MVQSQPRQIVHKILPQKIFHKNRLVEWLKDEGPEFKTQYYKKKKK
jgi:hypothetical protein